MLATRCVRLPRRRSCPLPLGLMTGPVPDAGHLNPVESVPGNVAASPIGLLVTRSPVCLPRLGLSRSAAHRSTEYEGR